MRKTKAIIMGAAGRDFHNFNLCFRNNLRYKIIAFTAAQIPDIAGRSYVGIPIYPEEKISFLIKKFGVGEVFFSYSDVSYPELLNKASVVLSAGAKFSLIPFADTMLKSKKPVIAVTAVRTGCGKSIVSQKIAEHLRQKGLRAGIIRHPMPYGDLSKQMCQKFVCFEDLKKHKCTIEEREEYEPYLLKNTSVYAGVDYEKILRLAEKENDIILWDGGNNDTPFVKPDLWITLADARRPGHEISYYPGELNFRNADILILTKMGRQFRQNAEIILKNAALFNPRAEIIKTKFVPVADRPEFIKGKEVLVVEDGPTMTHGGLAYGAGYETAKKLRAKKIVDPRKYAVGSLKDIFKKYAHLKNILPAMGYGAKQMAELEKTINNTECDTVVLATPAGIDRFLKIEKPVARVVFALEEIDSGDKLRKFVDKKFVCGN